LDRLGPVQLPLQPDAAAGGCGRLRADAKGIAGGAANRRATLFRHIGAGGGEGFRNRLPAASIAASLDKREGSGGRRWRSSLAHRAAYKLERLSDRERRAAAGDRRIEKFESVLTPERFVTVEIERCAEKLAVDCLARQSVFDGLEIGVIGLLQKLATVQAGRVGDADK